MTNQKKQAHSCVGAYGMAANTAYVVRDGATVPLPESGANSGDDRCLGMAYAAEAAYRSALGRPASVTTDADAYHYDRGVWAGLVLAYAHLVGHHAHSGRPLPGGTAAVRDLLLTLIHNRAGRKKLGVLNLGHAA